MRVKDKFFEKTKLIILILCFSQHLNAENFYAREISLPIYPSLSVESAKFVAKSIIKKN